MLPRAVSKKAITSGCQASATSTWASVRLGSSKRRLRPLRKIQRNTSWLPNTPSVSQTAALTGPRNRSLSTANQQTSAIIA